MLSKLLPYIAIFAAGAAAWFLADSRGYDRGKGAAEITCATVTVPAVRLAEQAQCEDDKTLTKETNDGLQTEFDVIKRRLANAVSVRQARCVVPVSGAPGKTIMAANDREHAAQDGSGGAVGVSTDWLYGYAAQCESIRQTGLSCVAFVDKVWKSRAKRL